MLVAGRGRWTGAMEGIVPLKGLLRRSRAVGDGRGGPDDKPPSESSPGSKGASGSWRSAVAAPVRPTVHRPQTDPFIKVVGGL